MEALLKMGAPIAALFTHRDDSHEEIWWRSCAELAARHGVPVHTDEGVEAASAAKIGALKPSIIYSFSYRHLIPESVLAAGAAGRLQSAPVVAAGVSGTCAGELGAGEWRARGGRHAASYGCARGRRRYRRAACGCDRRQRQRADAVPQAGAAGRRADRRAASEDRRGHRAAAKNGYLEGKLLRAQKAGGRTDRLAMAGAKDLQSRARRDASVSRRVLFRRRAKAAGMGSENWRRKRKRSATPGRVVRETADGALEIAAGEGSVIVKIAQFEGGVEGIAREALCQPGRVKDTIQFD